MMHTHHCANFVHAIPTGVYDDITIDVSVCGFDRPCIILMLAQPRHGSISVNLCARFSCVIGQGLTQLRGINIPVFTIPKTAK